MSFTPGMILNEGNDAYHASEGYSSSDIVAMAEGFDFWRWKKAQKKKPSKALAEGSCTHLLIEARIKDDPTLLDEIMVVEEGYQTKGYEKLWSANPGRILVNQESLDMGRRIADAVFENDDAMTYLHGAIAEPSIRVRDELGLKRKCRPDALNVASGVSVNFKTTDDASEYGFLKACKDYGYDWQSAWYLECLALHFGKDFDEVHLLAQKPAPGEPVRIAIYSIDDEDLAFAREQIRLVCERIPGCEETGIWPAPSSALKVVKMAPWARKVVSL